MIHPPLSVSLSQMTRMLKEITFSSSLLEVDQEPKLLEVENFMLLLEKMTVSSSIIILLLACNRISYVVISTAARLEWLLRFISKELPVCIVFW